jgi:phage-related minor tail protein
MAKLGDLIVRIGADTRDLNKQLGRVQREMRSMTGNLTKLGQNLTRTITVPLAGLGALAVKSAADLEKLCKPYRRRRSGGCYDEAVE